MKKTIYIVLDFILRTLYPTVFNMKIKNKILLMFGAEIGRNLFLDTDVYIKSPKSLRIGNDVVISSYTVITASGEVEIEDSVMIGYGCKILSQNHIIPSDLSVPIRFSGHSKNKVVIKKGSWIASNVIIMPGVTVGEGAVIGAGSIVTKDVEPYSIYVGNPAKKIKSR